MNKKLLNSNRELQAYIVGLALGDGNLSNPNSKAIRLRIACDTKYPFLIKKIIKSLQQLLPENKISTAKAPRNCIIISCYSNYWTKILGWEADKGSKFKQKVTIPKWILNNKQYKINCLRGLIETDGSIYTDRKYKMIIFTSIIPNLAKDFYEAIQSLNFKPHLYFIKQLNKHDVYHVRLSKNVSEFLKLVKPEKK